MWPMNALSPSSVLRRSPHVFCATVADEAVLYDDQRGEYFGLNPVAARIWQLADAGLTVGAILEQLQTEFEADAAQIASDMETLVADLCLKGLCVIESGETPASR
jgi:hypothetical protein